MARDLEKYLRPEIKSTPFCPGCGHGILMNLILRAIDELGESMDKMLFVSGIGCAGWIPSPHFNADTLHTLHGRAIAFATGAKMFNPALNVMVISGDGDLASIGGNHLIHAARRDTDLTVICANNMIYGMTGGQTASTTPLGSLSATSPGGNIYRPFDLCQLVLGAGGSYVARYSVTQPLSLVEAIKKALKLNGFSFIEVLSPCPTQFGRRNQYDSPTEMIALLLERCISKEEAEHLSEEDLRGKIITGEFTGARD
ncbi:MAG: 2-oxoacid:ferredoxin oxidoreductase subunit beta [Deltaproteobacteria bacterium]|nr:2-oxoacid:ferredoxin oxidoreductase subunit beta [Deltaproteobacteria bacterium]MBW1935964.1 2-oxoacid:ferredoxin oxidoreductase subunit beta [Deltaproteobacteria bacterium]MBW1978760.1 2-oxoacid:ferredoxin oxidoreductase subunit beta [Deltaproteobacteria bacterium]MBW2045701.1 2-oxoacid:ferredoxin oxidoreductase subunit beta [Deltaproteobacteria bacterium]MBW2301286.1 2-oxoacid:ferredoxin oxidoreductase subunit beta [Deltaproteobacteria bacterium]